MIKAAVIIPAAGSSRRFQSSRAGVLGSATKSKIEADLAGRPVFLRSVELFVNRPDVGQVILAVPPDGLADFKFRWGDKLGFHGVDIVAGGETDRWQTVLKALEAVKEDCTHVAVHDGARPLTSERLIDRVFQAAVRYKAVVPAQPVTSTLKEVADVDEAAHEPSDPVDAILGSAGRPETAVRRVIKTVVRASLAAAQTPQVFEVGLLRRAYAQIAAGKLDPAGVTDDACVVEALGETVYTVEGEPTNLKITQNQDMELAAAIVRTREHGKTATLGKRRLFADDED